MWSLPVDYLVTALVTLGVVVDPIGMAPAFLAVTERLSAETRRKVAVRACIIAAGVLTAVALGGNWFIAQLGISLPAFRISGGLLLFAVASEMVLGWRGERETRDAEQALEEHVRHIVAFPLAMPLMAGPGAITATLLLGGQASGQPLRLALLIAVVVAVMTACLIVFVSATRVSRLLGVTGNTVLSRLLGIVLAALAVQYVIDGVRGAVGG